VLTDLRNKSHKFLQLQPVVTFIRVGSSGLLRVIKAYGTLNGLLIMVYVRRNGNYHFRSASALHIHLASNMYSYPFALQEKVRTDFTFYIFKTKT